MGAYPRSIGTVVGPYSKCLAITGIQHDRSARAVLVGSKQCRIKIPGSGFLYPDAEGHFLARHIPISTDVVTFGSVELYDGTQFRCVPRRPGDRPGMPIPTQVVDDRAGPLVHRQGQDQTVSQ